MISYELKNICGNVFSVIFGVFFPILMTVIVGRVAMKDVPQSVIVEIHSRLFLTMSLIIPLSIMFISYAANYGMELEAKVPIRLQLFGFTTKQLLFHRLLAYLIFTTVGQLIYTISAAFILKLHLPNLPIMLVTVLLYYLLGICLLVIAHSIAYTLQKFGVSYGVTMTVYFVVMFTSGMMGVRPEQLPAAVRLFAKLMPTYHFASDYTRFWMGKAYSFAPMIQAYITMAAISLLLFIFSQWYRKRKGTVI